MNSLEFEPIYYLCQRGYPVKSQKLRIETDEKSYVNSKAMNGAPEFIESQNGGIRVFVWQDADREQVKDTRWVNEYKVLPMLKFQIIYSKSDKAEDLFISDRGELKKAIKPDELAQKVNRIYEKMDASGGRKVTQDNIIANYTSALLGSTEAYLRKYDAYDLNEEEFIKRVYYITRHLFGIYNRRLGSQFFSYVMLKKLAQKNIPAELIVTTASSLTEMKDVIFGDELVWLVRVKNKFVFNFSANSNVYDLKDDFLEADAYIVTLGKNPAATNISLPSASADQNSNVSVMEAALNPSLENVIVNASNTIKGISKEDNAFPALVYTEVYEKDHLSYFGDNELDNLSEAKRDEIDRLMRARRDEFKKRKPEYMKKQLQGEYESVISYDDFKLISDGRTFSKQELKYTERYTLGDMIKKAGKNFLVSVPALMGGQTQFKPADRNRQFDADIRYPHTLSWDISFTVPDGYTVKGLADLNQDIDNETGSFSSKAVTEGNILKLNIKKVYKQRLVKKEDFNKMLEFIDAAYNFSQKRILLKSNK
jgi:hypothetical protein